MATEALMMWWDERDAGAGCLVVTTANAEFVEAFRGMGWKEDRGGAGLYRTFRVGKEAIRFVGAGGEVWELAGISRRSDRGEVFDPKVVPTPAFDLEDAL